VTDIVSQKNNSSLAPPNYKSPSQRHGITFHVKWHGWQNLLIVCST